MGTPQSSRSASYIDGAAFAPVPEDISELGRGGSVVCDGTEDKPDDTPERRLLRAILKQALLDLQPLPEGGTQPYKDQVLHPDRRSRYYANRPQEAAEIREAALEFFLDPHFNCWGGFSFTFICDRLGFSAAEIRKVLKFVLGSEIEWERRRRNYIQATR